MREIMYLTGYEYKKIFQKRSTWIALALVALWTVFSGISGIIGDYYVEGEKAGTRYQMVKKEREALEHPEIGELNEDFFRREQEMSELYAPYDNYHVLLSMIEQQVGKIDKESMTTEDFYKMRKVMLENISKGQNLSEGERAFHMKENEQITTPYAYGNMLGFDYYFRMLPLNFVFLSLAAAIILAPMFAGEYTSHMDGLVLSSRFGKNKLIQAKLLTGISFGFLASMLFGGILLLEIQAVYGLSGWNLPLQVSPTGCYLSLPVNLLEFAGTVTACCAISTSMTAVFVMFFSVKMKSPFGVIIVSFSFITAPLFLIYMVRGHRLLFMLINSMPTSMVFPQSTAAHQLLSVGGHYFYFFQWVPVVYLCLMALLSWRSFCNFQKHEVCI